MSTAATGSTVARTAAAPGSRRLKALGAVQAVGALLPAPPLSVVPPLRPSRAPRTPFVVLVAVLLTVGLLSLLLLNTALAHGAFRLDDLERRSAVLGDQEQALREDVALRAAPERLASRAAALGMVPSENPVFIRAADGVVLGVPEPGKAAPAPRALPILPTVVPTPTPTPTPADAAAEPEPPAAGVVE